MRLLILTAALTFILAILFAGAVVLGATLPHTNVLADAGFDTCAGNPCFMNITPGITRFEEAAKILSQNNANTTDHFDTFVKDQEIDVFKASDNPMVDWLYLESTQSRPIATVGDVILRYGLPCGVYPSNLGTFELGFPGVVAFVARSDAVLKPDSPVVSLTLSVPSLTQRDAQNNCLNFSHVVAAAPWYGFTSGNYYRSHFNRLGDDGDFMP